MSFWFFKFSKKTPKNLTNFCPRTWKVLKSSKYRQCLILLQFTYDYMDYLMYLKTFLLWFDHFLDPWAEICQIFRWFFGKFKKSKRHSEIIWALRAQVKNNAAFIFNASNNFVSNETCKSGRNKGQLISECLFDVQNGP